MEEPHQYITCSRTKSKYRVNVGICEICKRRKNCPDYLAYRQPSLFPELLKGKRTSRAAYRRGNRRVRLVGVSDRPKQLALDL